MMGKIKAIINPLRRIPHVYIKDQKRMTLNIIHFHEKEYEYLRTASLPFLCLLINAYKGCINLKVVSIDNIFKVENVMKITCDIVPDKKMTFSYQANISSLSFDEDTLSSSLNDLIYSQLYTEGKFNGPIKTGIIPKDQIIVIPYEIKSILDKRLRLRNKICEFKVHLLIFTKSARRNSLLLKKLMVGHLNLE